MTTSDPPTREVPAPTGGELAGEEEVTRAIDRDGLLADIADLEPSTLPRASLMSEPPPATVQMTDDSPADGEGPTAIVPMEGTDRTLQRRSSRKSDPPPVIQERTVALSRNLLIGDDEVPVEEGTALLPGGVFGAFSAFGGILPNDVLPNDVLPVLPNDEPANIKVVVAAPSTPPPAVAPTPPTVLLAPSLVPPAVRKRAPPPASGWGRAVLVFIVAFTLTSAALVYVWHWYQQ